MPSGVFKPYAGVSTAILIFTKGGETNRVWFYDMQADGYTLDDKRNKIDASDLPDIVVQFKARNNQKENDREAKYFFVPKAEIIENEYDLSISKYKEEVYEEVVYERPKAIIVKLESIENGILSGIAELKQFV
jgi:type I restriction enzyme M protein